MEKVIDPKERKWFAFYTKPRHEFKAELELNGKNFEVYLPKITTVKQWSDRKKKVTEPLFKSYIFVFANEKERLLALREKTIVTCVNFGGKPAWIPNSVIEDLKTMLGKSNNLTVAEGLKVGTKVKILDGPFAGVTGVVYKNDLEENMFAITIELLNRSVVVRLTEGNVVKEVEF